MPAVDVQRDDVRLGQQFVHRLAAPRVRQREPVDDVVVDDVHAEVLGEHRQLGADVPVADDAKRSAANLVRTVGRLVPDARVHQRVLLGEMPSQRDDLGQRQFDDAAGVGERCVEHGNAASRSRREIDLVGADAERADRDQVRGRLEHARGHLGLRANTKQLDAGQCGDELVFVQRTAARFDRVIGFAQERVGIGVDLLEQQNTGRGLGHASSIACTARACPETLSEPHGMRTRHTVSLSKSAIHSDPNPTAISPPSAVGSAG